MTSLAKKFLKKKPSQAKLAIPVIPSDGIDRISHGTATNDKLNCTLLIVGAQGVGKTALVVRFLAKRFLPQYDGESDKTYERSVNIEGRLLNLTIIDKAGKSLMETVETLPNLSKIDGLVIVFSCSDSSSFDFSLDLLDYFKFDCKSTLNVPTLVIGNKTDLSHLRTVGNKEAGGCVLKYPGCYMEECSAAAQDDNVEVVFRSFIKQTLVKHDTRELNKNGRKSSIGVLGSPKIIRAHFKRRFSMFGRDRTGST